MSEEPQKTVELSEKLFGRLLAIYPRKHRAQYGPAMAQLFRDQCRDAWKKSRGWGVLKLWLRVAPDLLKTSIIEHIAAMKEKSLREHGAGLFHSFSAPWLAAIAVFSIVFVLLFGYCAVATFLLPSTYTSAALIRLEGLEGRDSHSLQAEAAAVPSETILNKVMAALNLKELWGKKYNNGIPLNTAETQATLKRSIIIRRVQNSGLEIKAYSDTPEAAAQMANGLAEAFRSSRQQGLVATVNRAVPNPDSVRPKKALNLFIGAVLGTILGAIAGAGTGGVVFRITRRKAVAF